MYENLLNDIYNVFASNEWKAENLRIFPESYTGDTGSVPYLTLSIAPSRSEFSSFGANKKLSGFIIVSIHVDTKSGDIQLYDIADRLDSFLQAKLLDKNTQFQTSHLIIRGIDPSNPSIYRGDYFVSFKNYGD